MVIMGEDEFSCCAFPPMGWVSSLLLLSFDLYCKNCFEYLFFNGACAVGFGILFISSFEFQSRGGKCSRINISFFFRPTVGGGNHVMVDFRPCLEMLACSRILSLVFSFTAREERSHGYFFALGSGPSLFFHKMSR
jgi:hypothetical protein